MGLNDQRCLSVQYPIVPIELLAEISILKTMSEQTTVTLDDILKQIQLVYEVMRAVD